MITWEYKLETYRPYGKNRPDCTLEEWLNRIGADGWELIAQRDSGDRTQTTFTFKRPFGPWPVRQV